VSTNGESKTLLNDLCLPSNDLNCAVASSVFNEILLSSSLKLPSVSAAVLFSALSLLFDLHSLQMFVLHSTTLKSLALLIFSVLSGRGPCVVCYTTITVVRPWHPATQRTCSLAVLHTARGSFIIECYYQAKPSQVILRPTVSRPVCLGVRHPFWTRNQFFLLFYFFLGSY
jgi:hypothetical protein